VAPLVVMYWRGTWDLLEDFIYPDGPVDRDDPVDPDDGLLAEDAPAQDQDDRTQQLSRQFPVSGLSRQTSGLICLITATLFRMLLDCGKFHLGEFLLKQSPPVRYLVGWIFNALNALFGVAFWRGIWFMYRLDLGVATGNLLIVQVVGVIFLSILRISKSLMASPLGIDMDDHEVTFSNGTFFQQTPANGWRFVGDIVFTNVVIRQVIVLTWWSCWSLENKYMYFQTPEGEVQEVVSWDSLLLGYSLAMVAVFLSQVLQRLSTTKLYVQKPIDLAASLLAFYASVNVWRGLWSLQSHYFLPSLQKDENYLLSHCLGLLALSLCSESPTPLPMTVSSRTVKLRK